MKQFFLLLAALFTAACLYAGNDTAISPEHVTNCASFGIGFDPTGGLPNMNPGSLKSAPISINGNLVNINGFSFTFLDMNGNGFAVPINFNFSSSNIPNDSSGVDSANSITISAGFYPIRQILKNDAVRLSFIYGIGATFASQLHIYPGGNYWAIYSSYGISVTTGFQAEVPLGGLIGVKPFSICLVSGINLTAGASCSGPVSGDAFNIKQWAFNFGNNASGYTPADLGISYYF
jgi:hypothetical protein